jgi:hypothetical protein
MHINTRECIEILYIHGSNGESLHEVGKPCVLKDIIEDLSWSRWSILILFILWFYKVGHQKMDDFNITVPYALISISLTLLIKDVAEIESRSIFHNVKVVHFVEVLVIFSPA